MSEDNYYFKAKLADENYDRKLLISDLDFDDDFLDIRRFIYTQTGHVGILRKENSKG